MLAVDVPYPRSIDALAAQLQQDPVLIHDTMGSGDAAGADARLTALASELPFPVYVALVEPPDDVDPGGEGARFLAAALSRRLGTGLYVVEVPDAVFEAKLVVDGRDDTTFSLQSTANERAVDTALPPARTNLPAVVQAELAIRTAAQGEPEDYAEPNLPDPVVDDLAQRADDLTPFTNLSSDADDEEPPESWSPGKRFMVGTVAGVGGGVLLWQTLIGWPGWRRRPQDLPKDRPKARPKDRPEGRPQARVEEDLEQLRRRARDTIDRLSDKLAGAATGPDWLGATAAREAADLLIDSDDRADLAGALVLARIGERQLSRTHRAYRPCFFDPLHAEGTRTASWRFGEASVEVPVCRACERTLDTGGTPQALRRGRRPYFEGDDLWARTGFGALADDLAAQVVADRARRRAR